MADEDKFTVQEKVNHILTTTSRHIEEDIEKRGAPHNPKQELLPSDFRERLDVMIEDKKDVAKLQIKEILNDPKVNDDQRKLIERETDKILERNTNSIEKDVHAYIDQQPQKSQFLSTPLRQDVENAWSRKMRERHDRQHEMEDPEPEIEPDRD